MVVARSYLGIERFTGLARDAVDGIINPPSLKVQVRAGITIEHTKPLLHHDRYAPLFWRFARHYEKRRDWAESAASLSKIRVPAEVQQALANTQVYFVPGFFNFTPGPRFARVIKLATGRDLTFLSTAGATKITKKNDITYWGGDDSVYCEDWRTEVPSVIVRLAHHFDPNVNPAFIGHSQGGLVVYVLAALRKYLIEHGKLSPKILAAFPELGNIDRLTLYNVFDHLRHAKFIALAAPLDGLGKGFLKKAKDTRFDSVFHDASESFTPEFLKEIYDIFGPGYSPREVLDGAIYAANRETNLIETAHSILTAEPQNLIKAPFTRVVDGIFEAGGHVLQPGETTDGVVILPTNKNFRAYAEIDANHLEAAENEEGAQEAVVMLAA